MQLLFSGLSSRDVVFDRILEQWKMALVRSPLYERSKRKDCWSAAEKVRYHYGSDVVSMILETEEMVEQSISLLHHDLIANQELLEANKNLTPFLIHSFRLPTNEVLINREMRASNLWVLIKDSSEKFSNRVQLQLWGRSWVLSWTSLPHSVLCLLFQLSDLLQLLFGELICFSLFIPRSFLLLLIQTPIPECD